MSIGIRDGLSVHVATLLGLLSIAGGAITMHRAIHLESIGERKDSQNSRIAYIVLIAILGGVILIFIPSPRLVIFDWPCREKEWALDAAEEKYIVSMQSWDYPAVESLSNKLWNALSAFELCHGRSPISPADIKKDRKLFQELLRGLETENFQPSQK